MSMFTRQASQRSFSQMPLDLIGQNTMSYLPPIERARLATVTGSFLPVSQGYYGSSKTKTEMHREYMRDMKLQDEQTDCIERERKLIPEKYIADKIYNPDQFELIDNYQRQDMNFEYVFPAIAQYGLICTLKMLIRQGRVNLRNEGNGFLAIAIYDVRYAFQNNRLSQCVDVIKFLLKSGVNPNSVYPGGLVPLLDAVSTNIELATMDNTNRPTAVDFKLDIEIIKLLLKHGADPTIRRRENMRASIKRLARYINPNMTNLPTPESPIDVMVTITEGPFAELQQKDPELYQFFMEVRGLFEEWIQNKTFLSEVTWVGRDYQAYGISRRKTTRRKTSKRKASKRKASKKTSKRKTSKRKASKRKTSRSTKRR